MKILLSIFMVIVGFVLYGLAIYFLFPIIGALSFLVALPIGIIIGLIVIFISDDKGNSASSFM
jgi:hypothetical protein